MRVSDILQRKGDFVATVTPETPVAGLLATLAEHNVGAVVVSADGSSVNGIVSERDVVRALNRGADDLLHATVGDIMTAEVRTVTPTDALEDLARLMTEQRIRHVPVMHDGRLAGIISIGDVVKSRIDQLESERSSLIGYITSGG